MKMEEQTKIIQTSGLAEQLGIATEDSKYGMTEELDTAVQKAAILLAEHYKTTVCTRFNINRKSGGAYLIDPVALGAAVIPDSSIGISIRLANTRIQSMSMLEFARLPEDQFRELTNTYDTLEFTSVIDIRYTKNQVPPQSPDILLGTEYKKYPTLQEAADHLFANCKGFKTPVRDQNHSSLAGKISKAKTQAKTRPKREHTIPGNDSKELPPDNSSEKIHFYVTKPSR